MTTLPALSFLSTVKAPVTSTTAGRDSPSSSSSAAACSSAATPLQTILKTLFGAKKHDSEASNSPSDQGGEFSVPPSTMLDPIVRRFAQSSKEKPMEEDEDDRPYDPEEEYDPSRGYNVTKKPVEFVSKSEISIQPEVSGNEGDDVAYDPEDDSIFDDVKTLVPAQAKPAAQPISDPQKILESLKQIGDQAFQKQEEQQISTGTIGESSVKLSDTLLNQPTKSLLANTQLLQLGKRVEELVKSSAVAPLINQRRDPRQSRDLHQTVTGKMASDEPEEKEDTSPLLPDCTLSSQPMVQAENQLSDEAEPSETSKSPEASQPQEEVKSEMLPFMESDELEVSIPLLGEEVEPDMEVNYLDDKVKTEKAEVVKAETEMDRYSIWPNAASILKAGEDSEYEENSQDTTATNYYNEPESTSTITSTIPVLTQSTALVDTQPHHIPHHMSTPGFDSKYRPPADIPPPSNFVPPHSLQGQNMIMRLPPMPMPPVIQGLPPMSGPPPMQGMPPPIHVPPPVPSLPPMQGDSSQQFGPPPPAYPPYQSQWPGTQPQTPPQQQPPPGQLPQNIMLPRGPPPFPPMAQRGPAPQMFDPSIPPQHTGQQSLPSGHPPPPTFEGQNSLAPSRFTGPPPLPPFNFPANRGPPPPFTGPPPAHFDNRVPPPSQFSSTRGPPPSQYSDHVSQQPLLDQSRGPSEQYHKDGSNHFKMDLNPNTLHIFKDNQGPLPGPAYRGPPPNQYEDRRGPPSSVEMSGPHFSPHNQYGSSRPHSSPPHRGSFDELRGPPPNENRPHPFGGSERYLFERLSDEIRPVRHSGPLLPTPPEGPLGPLSRMGALSPDQHVPDHWHRHSPEMRRRSSATQEDTEPRSGDRFSRFEVGNREPASGLSQPSEERTRELSEDRRGERDREVLHPGRMPWERGQAKRWSREREWDRGRDRDRDRSREREHSRGKESERQRGSEGERHRDQDTDKRRDRERERERERTRDSDKRDYDRDRARNRDRERERNRERDKKRDRSRSRERARDRDRGKDRGRDRDRDRDRERDRERDRDKDRDKDKDKDKERDKDRDKDKDKDKDRDRERTRDRDKDRERDRERDKDKDKDKERDRDRDREKERDPKDGSRGREKREEKKDSKHTTSKESDKTAETEKNTS